jgi:hypothetical protein
MFQKQSYSLRLLIDKISIRERYLFIATLVAVVLLLTQLLLVITGMNKHDSVMSRIKQKQTESARVNQLLLDYQAAINNPRIMALQNSNDDLSSKIELLEERIGDINEKLMSPDNMIALLKELIDKEQQLTVLSFNVLPVTTIESNVDGGNLFYQHSLSMTLEGEFDSLTRYLSDIEAQPNQLFWDDLIIETENFPTLKIKLNVHTLSQDEEWLNV